MGTRVFRNITDRTINVDGLARTPGEEFSIDTSRCADAGIGALLTNKYLQEEKK